MGIIVRLLVGLAVLWGVYGLFGKGLFQSASFITPLQNKLRASVPSEKRATLLDQMSTSLKNTEVSVREAIKAGDSFAPASIQAFKNIDQTKKLLSELKQINNNQDSIFRNTANRVIQKILPAPTPTFSYQAQCKYVPED